MIYECRYSKSGVSPQEHLFDLESLGLSDHRDLHTSLGNIGHSYKKQSG